MEFQIEKNVPIPEGHGRGTPLKYPWNKMEIGDSIVVPSKTGQQSALKYGQRYSLKFRTRKVDGGYRIWRVS